MWASASFCLTPIDVNVGSASQHGGIVGQSPARPRTDIANRVGIRFTEACKQLRRILHFAGASSLVVRKVPQHPSGKLSSFWPCTQMCKSGCVQKYALHARIMRFRIMKCTPCLYWTPFAEKLFVCTCLITFRKAIGTQFTNVPTATLPLHSCSGSTLHSRPAPDSKTTPLMS